MKLRHSLALAVVAVVVAVAPAQAKTISLTERAELRLVRKEGSTLYERGSATGTLPGRVTAVLTIRGTRVTGSVTFYPAGGSLTMNVTGQATSLATNAKFEGFMAVRRGTGKFDDATGTATFSGTVNRRSWAATVSARGRLTY